jgi:hypothetical protein
MNTAHRKVSLSGVPGIQWLIQSVGDDVKKLSWEDWQVDQSPILNASVHLALRFRFSQAVGSDNYYYGFANCVALFYSLFLYHPFSPI